MINYLNIHESIVFYESEGFTRIETPWTVTKEVSDITKPVGRPDLSIPVKDKVLVASGEQSFLYLYLKDYLPKGKFQTVTPCWRDDRYDGLHQKCFIKNELIDTENVTTERLMEIIADCKKFFEKVLEKETSVTYDKGTSTWDIECMGIELGSYGIRNCEFLDWIFATGCAEPRLSYVKKIVNNAKSKEPNILHSTS
jgi:hypothetical protein